MDVPATSKGKVTQGLSQDVEEGKQENEDGQAQASSALEVPKPTRRSQRAVKPSRAVAEGAEATEAGPQVKRRRLYDRRKLWLN